MSTNEITFNDTYAWAQESVKEKEISVSPFDPVAIGGGILVGAAAYFLLSGNQTQPNVPQKQAQQKPQAKSQSK